MTAQTRDVHTLDQSEIVADLERMAAYRAEYPEPYQRWFIIYKNSPIDMAERAYGGYRRMSNAVAYANLHRSIYQREKNIADYFTETEWQTMAAADRLTEYHMMAELA